MRRHSLLAFAILAILHLHAQVFTSSGLKYAGNGGGCVAIIGYSSVLTTNLKIPAQVEYQGTTYRVNSIRARAFVGQTKIMNLILPEQLDTIGQDAFYKCQYLRNVTGLKKLDVCEAYAFSKTSITSLDWSQVEIGTIGNGAFAQCARLTQVSLPPQLKSLSEAIFRGCTSLTSVNLSSLPLTSIGPRAFAQCSALQTLELPSTLTSIGDQAFADMAALTAIELPEGITTIGAQAFNGCTMLETLKLPDGLTTIGYAPFAGCNALREVMLPAKLSDIDNKYIFSDCPALENISIGENPRYYSCTDGVLRNRIGSKIIAYPAALSRQVHPTLRATAQPLAPGALMGCELDEDLLLPAQVSAVPREAFAGTSGMKSLEMANRSNLSSIEIRAFENSRDLTYVTIPSRMKNIDNAAFLGCDNIKDVFTLPTTVPTLAETAFSQTVYENAFLHTPTDKAALYEEATGWSLFNHIADDCTTDIKQTTTDERPVYYNLQGIRVSNPRKGIFIENTKKKIIKL